MRLSSALLVFFVWGTFSVVTALNLPDPNSKLPALDYDFDFPLIEYAFDKIDEFMRCTTSNGPQTINQTLKDWQDTDWVLDPNFGMRYIFDGQGRLVNHFVMGEGKWEQTKAMYDNDGNLVRFVVTTGDTTYSPDSFVVDYGYENGNVVSAGFSGEADVGLANLEAFKFEYKWNTEDRCTSWCAIDTQDNPNKTPMGELKFVYNGILLTDFSFREGEDELRDVAKATCRYDADSMPVNGIVWSWDESEQEWLPAGNLTYVYDQIGNRVEKVDSSWDETSQKWILDARDTISYGNNGKVAFQIGQIRENNQWVNETRSEWKWGSFGLFPDSIITSDWHDTEWELSDLIINTEGTSSAHPSPKKLTSSCDSMLRTRYCRNLSGCLVIDFYLNEKCTPRLNIYSLNGQLMETIIEKKPYNAGRHSITWGAAGSKIRNGVYVVCLKTPDKSSVLKINIVK